MTTQTDADVKMAEEILKKESYVCKDAPPDVPKDGLCWCPDGTNCFDDQAVARVADALSTLRLKVKQESDDKWLEITAKMGDEIKSIRKATEQRVSAEMVEAAHNSVNHDELQSERRAGELATWLVVMDALRSISAKYQVKE